MEERREDEQPQDEVKLPDERVEDLEPDSEDAQDVAGGKYTNIVLKRGADTNRL